MTSGPRETETRCGAEMGKKELSIIMPAHGEADNLRLLLPELRAVAGSLVSQPEILVVDAKSPVDDTREVCIENGVVCLLGGKSYADAIRTGIRASTGEYVIIIDADGSHNPRFLPVLWEKREVADVVIASRYAPGGKTDNPWLLEAMSRILNLVFRLVVGIPVRDVSNDFRLYRGDLLRSLELTCQHFDVIEEILARLLWDRPSNGLRILEVPYHQEQRKLGKPKRNLIVFCLHYLGTLYRLRRMRDNYRALRAKLDLAENPSTQQPREREKK